MTALIDNKIPLIRARSTFYARIVLQKNSFNLESPIQGWKISWPTLPKWTKSMNWVSTFIDTMWIRNARNWMKKRRITNVHKSHILMVRHRSDWSGDRLKIYWNDTVDCKIIIRQFSLTCSTIYSIGIFCPHGIAFISEIVRILVMLSVSRTRSIILFMFFCVCMSVCVCVFKIIHTMALHLM